MSAFTPALPEPPTKDPAVVTALPHTSSAPASNKAQLESAHDRLRLTPLPVRLLPDRSVQSILNYRTWKTQQMPLIEIQHAPLSAPERIAKRAPDISITAFAFACLLPMMLLVASAIRLGSPGPAIFRQRRKGFNGREFTIYKFRTMTVMEDGQERSSRRADRTAASPGLDDSSGRPAWTSCRNRTTFWAETCRWSDRGPIPLRMTSNAVKSSRTMRSGITCNRELPAGPRSTDSAPPCRAIEADGKPDRARHLVYQQLDARAGLQILLRTLFDLIHVQNAY